MKITKRQLRRIIKEAKAKLVTEKPDIPDIMGAMGGGKFQPRKEKGHPQPAAALRGGITDPDLDQLIIDYEDYVKAAGHISMAASSVAASFFMQDPERIEDHEAHQMLADAVGLDHTEIMRDMDRQKQEQSMSETLNWPDTWHRILGSTCKD